MPKRPTPVKPDSHPGQVSNAIKRALYEFNCGPGTKVLQVGACCGSGGDPIYPLTGPHKRWIFFRVEPRIDMFDKLARLHSHDDNVLVHQCAVIPDEQEEGPITMYEYQQVDGLPSWTKGVASLDKTLPERNNNWRQQKKPDQVKTDIVPVEVLGQHFSTMMREMQCVDPDAVVTDMEGFDKLVILPAIKLKPKVLCYEHKVHGKDDNQLLETAIRQASYEEFFRGPEDVVWILRG